MTDEAASAIAAPTTPPAYDGAHGAACAVVSVILGLTQSLTVFGINNNLSALQGALGATAVEAGWLSTAYFATGLSAVVLITKLRIQVGMERFATWAIAAFALVSLWSFLAPSLANAIAARAALGLAAASLITLAVLYMLEAVPPALAPVGAALGLATLQFGSPLGRVIAQPLFDASPGMGLPMFDVALALLGVAAINAVPLHPTPRQKVFTIGDAPAFLLYASGLALLCIVITQGRARWWTDTAWLGTCLAGGIACIGAYVMLDLWRDKPLIDLRWLASPAFRWCAISIIVFRIGLSEQPTGAVGLMNVLGINNDQMRVLFGWVTFGIALGFAVVVVGIALRSLRSVLLASLALVVVASLLDANATSLTRPHDIVVSQLLIAVATAMFLGSTFVLGLLPVVQDGLRNIVSFLAMFSGSQNLGSLIGAAWLGTYVADQQHVHVARLVESISLADPQVALRATHAAAAQAGVVVDPLLRGTLGVGSLAQQVAREAWVLAYGDLFRRVAFVAALTFVWLAVYWGAHWWRDRARAVAAIPEGAHP